MKLVIFTLFFIFIMLNTFSLQNKEMDKTHNTSVENGKISSSNGMGNTTIIVGKIQIYGNEPHTFVGIIDENGMEYAVYSLLYEDELRKLQGYLIEFKVVMLDKPHGYEGLLLKGGTVTPIIWKVIK